MWKKVKQEYKGSISHTGCEIDKMEKVRKNVKYMYRLQIYIKNLVYLHKNQTVFGEIKNNNVENNAQLQTI